MAGNLKNENLLTICENHGIKHKFYIPKTP